MRPGQESVWDYPRPPRVEPVTARLRVEHAGLLIAETESGLRVVETAGAPVYYFPPADVRLHFLEPSSQRTLCEWKGEASYWSLRAGDLFVANVAWSYVAPLYGYEAIRGRFAFYASRLDACFVGHERVRPQPGDFYGGWITSNLIGPFKGEPGTEGW